MRDHNCESGGAEQLQGENGCTLCSSVSFLHYQSHMLSSLLKCVYIHGKKFEWK